MNAAKSLTLVAVVVFGGSADHAAAQGIADPVLSPCYIRLKNENLIRIPAEEAGVLIEMPVQEGTQVKAGQLLARIDDREATAQMKIAEYALESATKRAEEDIEIRYAQAAEAVAKADYKQDLQANHNHPGAIPETEVRRKNLEWRRASLQIEKAQKDQVLAGLEAKTKEAERDAARMALTWRTIYAPFDGEVLRTGRQEAEWVNPGDLILELARFDTLKVECNANARDFNRGELQGKNVTVTVTRARGQKMNLPGKIVYVEPVALSDGTYSVHAEIQNKREGDGWAILPGLEAEMKIHMK